MLHGILYFAYGSNLAEEQMGVRCPGAVSRGTARLAEHRIAFTRWSPVWQGGVADVVASPGNEVWGLLWSVTHDDLATLDAHEGHPVNYRRSLHAVKPSDAARRDAWVYEVVDKQPYVRPAEDYLETVLAAAATLDLPTEHLQQIRSAAGDLPA